MEKNPRALSSLGSVFNKNGLPPRREEWQWAMRSVPSLWHPRAPLPPPHSGTGLESFKSESWKTRARNVLGAAPPPPWDSHRSRGNMGLPIVSLFPYRRNNNSVKSISPAIKHFTNPPSSIILRIIKIQYNSQFMI